MPLRVGQEIQAVPRQAELIQRLRMNHFHVAAGILCDAEGRILIAERLGGGPFQGLWEFPGGKIGDGETSAEALSRELAEELGRIAPGDLSKVLFTTGGSAAVEVALKLARAATGRFKTVSFWDAFHGAGFGASSVGGEATFRSHIAGPLMAAYLAAYKWIGFGIEESGMYVDPLAHPLRFLRHAALQLPVLCTVSVWVTCGWTPAFSVVTVTRTDFVPWLA